MYDGVLTLQLPSGVEFFGFAEDAVLMVTGEMLEEVGMERVVALDSAETWITEVKLQLARHKPKVVLMSNQKAVYR